MLVRDLVQALDAIAPPDGAESWDNTGLLLGSEAWPAARVLLTIDLTPAVLAEAIRRSAQAVVAYHPPVFSPIRAVNDRTPTGRIALEAIRAGIAVHSPHTRLDAAAGGVNDWLAEAFGTGDRRAIAPLGVLPADQSHKLVTFVPAEAVERVRDALASIGAGRIGAYRRCSFESPGTGTFEGDETTNPAVGTAGTFERVPEVRLEMVCAAASLPLAVEMLRHAHPYEEPAYEIHALQPRPQRARGGGRRVRLDRAATFAEIVAQVKAHLGVDQLEVATAHDAPKRHHAIGLCAGAGGSFLDAAIAQECTVFLTGEMRHHDVLAAQARGCNVILAGHTNTERGFLPVLRKRLHALLPDAELMLARSDRHPLALA